MQDCVAFVTICVMRDASVVCVGAYERGDSLRVKGPNLYAFFIIWVSCEQFATHFGNRIIAPQSSAL